ncbi:MAG: hypothetical protein PHP37_01135 [Patescibacteria group bacterium]|nr:hypothetical protein [Patescibacteria group bacterium]
MKKFFIIVFVSLLFVQISQAQISGLTSKDSSITASVYAGVLNTTAFSVDESAQEFFYSFRVGSILAWQALPFMRVKSFATFDYSDGNGLPMNSVSIKFHSYKERMGLEIGRMATLSTELRPLPPTGDGHFETWTHSRIPGGALGAKATYRLKNGICLGLGVAERGDKAEYHAKLYFKKAEFVSYYSVFNERIGAATVFSVGRLYNVISFERIGESNVIANFSNVDIGNDMSIYLDAGYESVSAEFPRMEFGFIKGFKFQKFGSGLIALGYKHESKAINAYLFVHL